MHQLLRLKQLERTLGQINSVTFTNGAGVTVNAGSFVRVSANDTFALTSSPAAVVGLLGVAIENISASQQGTIVIAGIVDVLMEIGLGAVTVADFLYPSTVLGRMTNQATASSTVGIIVNASNYAGQQKVRAVLRIPVQ